MVTTTSGTYMCLVPSLRKSLEVGVSLFGTLAVSQQRGSSSWLCTSFPCASKEALGCVGSLRLLFESSQHPTNGACTVLWEHLISKFLLVTGVGKCE